MSDLILAVKDKHNEYGLDILNEYPVNNKCYAILTKMSVIFIHLEEKSISITFDVKTKGDDIANYILVLKEIPEIEDIEVMECFTYDRAKNFVSGEKAFEVVKEEECNKAVQCYIQQQKMREWLARAECFHC
jgi:hypothetical protein